MPTPEQAGINPSTSDWHPRVPIRSLPLPGAGSLQPTWRQAKPARIEAAVNHAQQRNPGGWYVLGSSTALGRARSVVRTVAGREVVLWRDERGGLVAGPGACPHLGAALDRCPVIEGALHCRWHGYRLASCGDSAWRPYPACDDGVLLWVRLDVDEPPAAHPTIAARPPLADSIVSVLTVVAACEPRDIIANRLDPWHGAWFHPYAFSHLTVDDVASDESRLTVEVAFRLGRRWGIPVRATFSCPDARTVVMTIVDGEGSGSVVETHATPVGTRADHTPVTMLTEATIAYSDQRGFALARTLSPLLRPAIRAKARQLWVDDLAYAERLYRQRARAGQQTHAST